MTNLKQFLDEMHSAAILMDLNHVLDGEGDTVIQYLNQLAAAQNDLDRCSLVNRMRKRRRIGTRHRNLSGRVREFSQ
jgi:hypothetical protein